MVALADLVEVDEMGVGSLGPGPGGLVELVREDADGRRDGDALEVEEAELVLPVEADAETPVFVSQYSVTLSRTSSRVRLPTGCPSTKAGVMSARLQAS